MNEILIEDRFIKKYLPDSVDYFIDIDELFGCPNSKLKFGDSVTRRMARVLGTNTKCNDEVWDNYYCSISDAIIPFTPDTVIRLINSLDTIEGVYMCDNTLIMVEQENVKNILVSGLSYYNQYYMEKSSIHSIANLLDLISKYDKEFNEKDYEIINYSKQLIQTYYNNKINSTDRKIDIMKRDLKYLEKKKENFESDKKKIRLSNE